jgi:branched-subunit amino acid aminotransferase/4-amino-4-deoxychorismate lyase
VSIGSNDRGLWYGEGFFETIRYRGTSAPLWHYHQDRIERSANYFDFELPMEDLSIYLSKEVIHLPNSKINIGFCLEGSSGYTRLGNEQLQVYFRQEAISSPSVPLILQISVSQEEKLTPGLSYTRIKSLSGLPYTIASREKTRLGKDELLLINEHGKIAEAISNNVFVLKNGIWYTPPLSDGGVAGVFRAMILDRCISDTIDIQEKSLDLREILESDGVMLTNALRGAHVVGHLNGSHIPTALSMKMAIYCNEIAGFVY